MSKAKPSLWRQMSVCLCAHFSAWLHSPRVIVMGIVILCHACMHARNFDYILMVNNYTAHLGEMAFSYLNRGFQITMASTFLLVMMSELPKRMSFQYAMLLRVTRGKWLASLILFCLIAVLLMLVLLTGFSVALSMPYVTPGGGWSDLERLAENPDYKYAPQFVQEYIRVLNPLQACLCAASVVGFFWFTMLLVILLFSLLNHPNVGMLIYMFILLFHLTFMFEILDIRTPIHYATLEAVSVQFHGNVLASLPLVLGVYASIDLLLISLMALRVRRMDLQFT